MRAPIFRNFNMLLHSFADETQIYCQLKLDHSFWLKPLFDWLTEVKAWIASNVLHFGLKQTTGAQKE